MIKTPPTLLRLTTMVVFALSSFGALLYLWMAFGGAIPFKPVGYRFDILVPEATQLAGQADVRISGVSVGRVVDVEPGPGNRTRATIEMDREHAPVARDGRAMLRLKSLLGETYVELERGNPSRGVIPDGGTLAATLISPTVELDEILRTFDPETRDGFRRWMQSSSAALRGRGDDVNAAFAQLPGFVEKGTDLFATLDAQAGAVRSLVASTGDVFDAISAQDGELAGLITATDRLFGTTARRNRELQALFGALPRFEAESRRTLPVLTAFGDEAEPVVRRLQPVATELDPTFAALRDLAPELEAFFGKLSPVVTASERGVPALEKLLADLPPLLDAFGPWLRNVNPMVGYLGEHRRELTAFIANTTAATLGRDLPDVLPGAKGAVNYLRTVQTLSPEALAFYPRPLGSSRMNAYQRAGAFAELAAGLPSLTTRTCANGTPAPPAAALPEGLAPLVQQHVFRTPGRDVLRPACRTAAGGPAFPRLRAER